MQTLFQRHFWIVQLVFLALAAWLCARTVNAFVRYAIAPKPAASAPSSKVRRTAVTAPPRASLEFERLAKLTGIPVPAPEPEIREPELPEFDPAAEPVRSALRVRLLGTMIASPRELSLATIEDQTTRDSATWMVGDVLQGARILEIERERVIVLANGRREFIDGTAGAGPAIAAKPAPQRPAVAARVGPKGGPELGSTIRATSENTYEVPRAEIDNTLSNLNSLAMKARIVPAFKDGKATGFKLFSIRPNSLYSKIGIQNGDVIKRINGYDLNSPEKALEIYTKLKEATRIDLELERGGTTLRKTYNIR